MSSCSLAMLAKWVVAWVEMTLYMVFLPLPRARRTRPKTRWGRFGRVLRKFSSRGDAPVRLGGGGMLLLTPTRRHGSCVALSPCLSEPFGDIR